MENRVINIDFENLTDLQIMEIEEKTREHKHKSLERRVVELENWKRQAKSEINILIESKNELMEFNKKLLEDVESMRVKTSQVTDTLLTHGMEKRKLENVIHKLVYNEIKKDSLKDQLFHGTLTAKCKAHIEKSLGVTAFHWIEVKDVSMAEGLAKKFLNKVTIHNEMQKKAIKLDGDYEKLKGKMLTDRQIKQKGLLELLIDECGGDKYAI